MTKFSQNYQAEVDGRTFENTQERLLKEARAYGAAGMLDKAQEKMREYEAMDFVKWMTERGHKL